MVIVDQDHKCKLCNCEYFIPIALETERQLWPELIEYLYSINTISFRSGFVTFEDSLWACKNCYWRIPINMHNDPKKAREARFNAIQDAMKYCPTVHERDTKWMTKYTLLYILYSYYLEDFNISSLVIKKDSTIDIASTNSMLNVRCNNMTYTHIRFYLNDYGNNIVFYGIKWHIGISNVSEDITITKQIAIT